MDNAAKVFGFSATACCRALYFNMWFIWICFECRRFSITSKLAFWYNVDLFWKPCRSVNVATKELLHKTRATRTYKLHWAAQGSLERFSEPNNCRAHFICQWIILFVPFIPPAESTSRMCHRSSRMGDYIFSSCPGEHPIRWPVKQVPLEIHSMNCL